MTPSLRSPGTHSPRRAWVGPWLMLVAAGHTVVGLLMFGPALRGMFERGLFNSVGADPMAAAAAWFMLFGAPLALMAWLIWQAERAGQALRAVGAGIVAITLLGVVLMPVSGFWLALPAGLALLWRRPRGPGAPGPGLAG